MEDRKRFKPFDRVLVKYGKVWVADVYSNYVKENNLHLTLRGTFYDNQILPYEGNEHLVGTTGEEEVRLEEGEWVAFIKGAAPHDGWTIGKYYKLEDPISLSRKFYIWPISEKSGCYFCTEQLIKFSDFNPEDMEETKKHVLCVRNGRICKYKG